MVGCSRLLEFTPAAMAEAEVGVGEEEGAGEGPKGAILASRKAAAAAAAARQGLSRRVKWRVRGPEVGGGAAGVSEEGVVAEVEAEVVAAGELPRARGLNMARPG